MVDSPTTRNRFRKQERGTNVNSWGDNLNEALDAIDQCLDGVETINLGGATTYTLTTTNYTTADQAKQRFLLFTNGAASGCDVTIPSVEHWYGIINDAGGTVTLQTSAGATVDVPDGERALIYCDGNDVMNGAPTVIGAQLKSVTAGTADTDAVNVRQMALAIAASVPLGTAGTFFNSINDTTRSYLNDKLTVSGSLVKTTTNPGANEATNIAFTFDEGNQVLLGGVLGI